MSVTESGLLREVAVVQRDKTLQIVRDLVDSIPVTVKSPRDSWRSDERTARQFKDDLVQALKNMRDES